MYNPFSRTRHEYTQTLNELNAQIKSTEGCLNKTKQTLAEIEKNKKKCEKLEKDMNKAMESAQPVQLQPIPPLPFSPIDPYGQIVYVQPQRPEVEVVQISSAEKWGLVICGVAIGATATYCAIKKPWEK